MLPAARAGRSRARRIDLNTRVWVACLLIALAAPTAAAAEIDWPAVQNADVVEILTDDEDGERRETKVWIVSFDAHGYVRTNDSRWLANIRRGSSVALRLDDHQYAVDAAETSDAALTQRVEQAFREKYGFVQRVMSFFRITEPTVLVLTARTEVSP
jgi:hypothetical protein